MPNQRFKGFKGFKGFRGLEGLRGLERLEGLEGFRGLGAGKRQAWTPIKSHGCGLLPALEAHKKPLKWPVRGFRGLEGFRPLKWPSDARWLRMPGERHAGPPRNSNPWKWPSRGFRGLERFRAGKRQAWTPIKSHGCGLGMPVAKKDKFHTCGGPRRRPCLGEGRGRRIFLFHPPSIGIFNCHA